MTKRWHVRIAGEGDVLATVRADDEASARREGLRVLDDYRARLAISEDTLPSHWLRVTPEEDDAAD